MDGSGLSGQRKIMHLSSVHPWDDVRIFHKQARSALKARWEVSILARESLHPQYLVPDYVEVMRTPTGRLWRALAGNWHVLRKAFRENADIYQFHDPELIGAGMVLRLFGKKVIYDVHENVPADILEKPYLPELARRVLSTFFNAFEKVAGGIMSGVICVNESIAKRFPADSTCVVRNSPVLSEFSQLELSKCEKADPIRIIYAGVCSPERGLETLVEAIDQVDSELVLAGRFSSAEFMERLKGMPGWRKVQYMGTLPREEAINEMLKSDVGIVAFHQTKNNLDACPNKLFEYMAAGLAVIASDFPEWKQIVEKARCGYVVNPGDASDLAAVLRRLSHRRKFVRHLGGNGRHWVSSHRSWDIEADQLMRFLQFVSSDANRGRFGHGSFDNTAK